YWDDLVKTARQSPKMSDKIKVFLKPPGWFPAHLGGFQNAPEIDVENYKKYNPQFQSKLTGYVLVQFLIALTAGSVILFSYTKLDALSLVSGAVFTICTLITCGALLEQKHSLIRFEYFRLTLGFLLVFILKFPIGYQLMFAGIQLISVIWYFNLHKAKSNVNEN
ncbi:MAG: sterol desaturase family protein, partial [Pedobacter sp.]